MNILMVKVAKMLLIPTDIHHSKEFSHHLTCFECRFFGSVRYGCLTVSNIKSFCSVLPSVGIQCQCVLPHPNHSIKEKTCLPKEVLR